MKNNNAPGEERIRLEFLSGMHSQGLISWHQICKDIWKQGRALKRN